MEIDRIVQVQSGGDPGNWIEEFSVARRTDEPAESIQRLPIGMQELIGLPLIVARMAGIAEAARVINRLVDASMTYIVAVVGEKFQQLCVDPLHEQIDAIVAAVEMRFYKSARCGKASRAGRGERTEEIVGELVPHQ